MTERSRMRAFSYMVIYAWLVVPWENTTSGPEVEGGRQKRQPLGKRMGGRYSRAHVNVGFFCGTELKDPARLLEGTGKYLRHVKVRSGSEIDAAALDALIAAAYRYFKAQLFG